MPITKATASSIAPAAKGDLVVGSATNDASVLAVGNNGETLVADSSATTGLRWTATPSASNPIINGGFDIWQRGTSFANPSSNAYVADRFQQSVPTNTTISRQATGDTTNLPSIQYCLRVQRNSGATTTGALYLGQASEIENCVPFAGKTVTFSFYARRGANYSGSSNNLNLAFFTGTSSTQQNGFTSTYTGSSQVINESYALTETWQRFTKTVTFSSNITQFAFWFVYSTTGTAGAADYFEVTGVQIDVGSVALPFRRTGNTLAGELAACQRYFQQLLTGTKGLGIGNYYSASGMAAYVYLPVEMRTTPTLSATSGTNYYAIYATTGDAFNSLTLSADSTSRLAILTNTTEVSGTAGNAGEVYGNSASASVGVSAEL